MKLYIIVNRTLGHYVTTQKSLEQAELFIDELRDSMDMEYTITEVEV